MTIIGSGTGSGGRSQNVIMVTTESDDLKTVAEAVRLGAFDYVPKPIREDDIRIRVTKAVERRSLVRSHTRAVTELASGREFEDIVGNSPAIRDVVHQARNLASYDVPVLVTGETGTGKELIARALHYGGPRRDKPFVSINCAGLPTELTESELFGHEKGAFTGAYVARKGAFDEAGDGTLFLDEIGDMNLTAQATLLHVLERGEYRTVGGKEKRTHARIVIATNQDLDTLIRENRFRKDLYYRVNRVHIEVPPLRNRRDDVPLLAGHFLRQTDQKIGKGIRKIAAEALGALQCYDWPGNVRELKNEIERAYIYANNDELTMLDLSPGIATAGLLGEDSSQADPKSLDEVYKLIGALKTTGGNVTKAAEVLGVHRNTVHRWMRRFGLQKG